MVLLYVPEHLTRPRGTPDVRIRVVKRARTRTRRDSAARNGREVAMLDPEYSDVGSHPTLRIFARRRAVVGFSWIVSKTRWVGRASVRGPWKMWRCTQTCVASFVYREEGERSGRPVLRLKIGHLGDVFLHGVFGRLACATSVSRSDVASRKGRRSGPSGGVHVHEPFCPFQASHLARPFGSKMLGLAASRASGIDEPRSASWPFDARPAAPHVRPRHPRVHVLQSPTVACLKRPYSASFSSLGRSAGSVLASSAAFSKSSCTTRRSDQPPHVRGSCLGFSHASHAP